jgi:hypothetical protein
VAIPEKPQPIIVTDPADASRKFRLDIDVDVYKCSTVPPRSDYEKAEAEKKGYVKRILYCRRTYDHAVAKARELIKAGHRQDRIEFIHADRDEVIAIKNGDVELVLLDAESAAD